MDTREVISLGWDTAPGDGRKADWCAGVALSAVRVCEAQEPQRGYLFVGNHLWWVAPIWAVVLKNRTQEQLSGVVHYLHLKLGCSIICMDKGGGGAWVYQTMRKSRQLIDNVWQDVPGLTTLPDAHRFPGTQPIVCFYTRGDVSLMPVLDARFRDSDEGIIELAHRLLKSALVNRSIHFPKPPEDLAAETRREMSGEALAACAAMATVFKQLGNIQVRTDANNHPMLTARGYLRFFSKLKKDAAMAFLYAFMGLLAKIEQQAPDGLALEDGFGGRAH